MVHVDALYAFDTVGPSRLLFDVTQILTDFHLLSEYHRRTFGVNQRFGLFKYLAASSESSLTHLYHSDRLAKNFTHIVISDLATSKIAAIVNRILVGDSLPEHSFTVTIYDRFIDQIDKAAQLLQSDQPKHSLGMGESQLLTELLERNAGTLRSRKTYEIKYHQ